MIKAKGYHGNEIELDQCPFCGSDPELVHIGNYVTKNRKVTIRCSNRGCRIERTVGAIQFGFEWIEHQIAKHWNKRAAGVTQ